MTTIFDIIVKYAIRQKNKTKNQHRKRGNNYGKETADAV